MILQTFIPDFAFSSQVSNIALTSDSDVKFTLYRISDDNKRVSILSELYVPDNDTMIYIIDLHKIINSYLDKTIVGDYVFVFENDDDVVEKFTRIILSRSEINVTAPKFVANRFLSLMKGDKNTLPDSKELLSVYSFNPDKVMIKAFYRDDVNEEYFDEIIAGPIVKENAMTGIDVSPQNYLKDGFTLVRYSVVCGDRTMNYWMDNLSNESPLSLLFSNNFGVIETYSISGLLQWEPKFTNDIGTIRGEYNRYDIEFYREYTANTGVMNKRTADWLEVELFSALQVYGVKDSHVWKKLIISDQTIKRTSSDSETPAFEFKYRISQRNQDVIDFSDYLHRVFDVTFDKSFD